jgi:hypothetical protein
MSPFGGRADILRAARRTGDRTPARVIHRGEPIFDSEGGSRDEIET